MDSPEKDPVEDAEVESLLNMLKQAIHDSRRSRREVERSLGLGQGYLGSLFKGRIELKVWHVYRLARVLGLDPFQFFFKASPPQDRDWVLRQMGYDPARLPRFDDPPPPPPPAAPAPEESRDLGITKAEVTELIRQAVQDELERRGISDSGRGEGDEPR